jgi:leucyl aminopeptidase
MTQVTLKSVDPQSVKLGGLAVFLYEGDTPPRDLDASCGGSASRALRLGDFKGKLKQVVVLYGGAKADRTLLVGLGPRKGASAEGVRRGMGAAVREAKRLEIKKLGVVPPAKHAKGVGAEAFAAAVSEAAVLTGYSFLRHQTQAGAKGSRSVKKATALAVTVFGERGAKAALQQAVKVADAVNLARDLANEPGNFGTPRALAAAARKAGKESGFKVKILEPAEMKRLGMGGLLGVAKGSHEPPRFIQMEYTPRGKTSGGTVCLVGKGLTFDAGGISLKSADKMWDMKFDKCGGCAVIGAMKAIASCKLPVKVIGLVPATENMPGGAANKPGDILTALNGKTIEVLNTDAEGRLILADALAYSARFKPDVLVDMATLTGSVVVALGDVRAGLMSVDDKLSAALRAAGDAVGERVWPLPMDDAYGEHVKSDIADVKNLGKGRTAGSIAGGWFLRNFVPDGTPWAHLDIAGTAWNTSDPGGYLGKGATGFGVRLAFEFVRARAK